MRILTSVRTVKPAPIYAVPSAAFRAPGGPANSPLLLPTTFSEPGRQVCHEYGKWGWTHGTVTACNHPGRNGAVDGGQVSGYEVVLGRPHTVWLFCGIGDKVDGTCSQKGAIKLLQCRAQAHTSHDMMGCQTAVCLNRPCGSVISCTSSSFCFLQVSCGCMSDSHHYVHRSAEQGVLLTEATGSTRCQVLATC